MTDLKKQSLKAWKYLMDIESDDVLEKIGLQQRTSPWMSALGGVGIFAFGCLVGAGIGLAFAPKRGEDLRNELGEKLRKKADELKPLAEEFAARAERLTRT